MIKIIFYLLNTLLNCGCLLYFSSFALLKSNVFINNLFKLLLVQAFLNLKIIVLILVIR